MGLFINYVSQLRVDFIKVVCMMQIIEIALSIYPLFLRQTFEKLLTGVKVRHIAQKISVECIKVYEIDPR